MADGVEDSRRTVDERYPLHYTPTTCLSLFPKILSQISDCYYKTKHGPYHDFERSGVKVIMAYSFRNTTSKGVMFIPWPDSPTPGVGSGGSTIHRRDPGLVTDGDFSVVGVNSDGGPGLGGKTGLFSDLPLCCFTIVT